MKPKPLLYVSAFAALGIGTLYMFSTPVDPRRKQIVNAVLSQIGEKDPLPYWRDAMPNASESEYPKDWCGGFALWAVHQGGIGKTLEWLIANPNDPKHLQGFLIPNLMQTRNPQPGDIAYFDHNQHHAVVADVFGDSVQLVNGNGVGEQVTVSSLPKQAVTAFFSIEPLLKKSPLPAVVT